MLSDIDDYDWKEAFDIYGRLDPVPGYTGATSAFGREDVKRIIAIEDGYPDEEDWIGVFELHDGRFVSLVAGCCYSGWD